MGTCAGSAAGEQARRRSRALCARPRSAGRHCRTATRTLRRGAERVEAWSEGWDQARPEGVLEGVLEGVELAERYIGRGSHVAAGSEAQMTTDRVPPSRTTSRSPGPAIWDKGHTWCSAASSREMRSPSVVAIPFDVRR